MARTSRAGKLFLQSKSLHSLVTLENCCNLHISHAISQVLVPEECSLVFKSRHTIFL